MEIIGQRSVNLMNQLYINQSGGTLNFLKQNILILEEDEEYSDDKSEILNEENIKVEGSSYKEEIVSEDKLDFNQIEVIFYVILAFSFLFPFIMRAPIHYQLIKLNQGQLKQFYYILDKAQQQAESSDMNYRKIKKINSKNIKKLQNKYKMMKYQFSLNKEIKSQQEKQSTSKSNFDKIDYNQNKNQPPNNISHSPKVDFENQINLINASMSPKSQTIPFSSFYNNSNPEQSTEFNSSMKRFVPLRKSIFSTPLQKTESLNINEDSLKTLALTDHQESDPTQSTEARLITNTQFSRQRNSNVILNDNQFEKFKQFFEAKENCFENLIEEEDDKKEDDYEEEEEQKNNGEKKKTSFIFDNSIAKNQNIFSKLLNQNDGITNKEFKCYIIDEQSEQQSNQTQVNQNEPNIDISPILKQDERNSVEVKRQKTLQEIEMKMKLRKIQTIVDYQKEKLRTEDYEFIIDDVKEKRANPRFQSIKNVLKAKNLAVNIKHNEELINGISKENKKREKQKNITFKKFQKDEDEQKMVEKMIESTMVAKQDENKIKEKKGYKFIYSLQKKIIAERNLHNLLEMKNQILEKIVFQKNTVQNNVILQSQRHKQSILMSSDIQTREEKSQTIADIYSILNKDQKKNKRNSIQVDFNNESNKQLNNNQDDLMSNSDQLTPLQRNQRLRESKLPPWMKEAQQQKEKFQFNKLLKSQKHKRNNISEQELFFIKDKGPALQSDSNINPEIMLNMVMEEIEIKKNYIQMIANILDSHLQITKLNIFQIYSIFKYDEKIFSNRFTKCLMFTCQLVITVTANLLLIPDTNQLDNLYQLQKGIQFTFAFSRVIPSLLLGYFIPYFFFGSLTGVFASTSKSIKDPTIKQINQIRQIFISIYILIGLVQLAVCFSFLYFLKDYQTVINEFQFSAFISEILFCVAASSILIDGLYFVAYYFNYKSKDGVIETSRFTYMLACRGYFYYKGFDNLQMYEQYFIAKMIQEE